MQVLGVAGYSETGKTTLVEQLVSRLADDRAVATVKHLTHAPDVDTEGKDTARHRAAGAGTTVGVTDDESWFGTGRAVDPDAVLSHLAPAYDVAIVEGFSDARLPKVVLGDRPCPEPILATAPNPDAIDLDDLLGTLAERPGFETRESILAGLRPDPTGTTGTTAPDTVTGVVSGRVPADDRHSDDGELGTQPTGRRTASRTVDVVSEELESVAGVETVLVGRQPDYFLATAGRERLHVGVRLGGRNASLSQLMAGFDDLAGDIGLEDLEFAVGGSTGGSE
jgi:molybdopterin synthase catalytic subunit